MTENPLITALQNPKSYDHPVSEVRLFETHISWVILTGEYAYKIKKPVDLGFLDFSSLELRKHYCDQELLLNRRLAPELYLDVVRLTGTADQPSINGEGEPFEYAVKMRQFDPEQQLDKLLSQEKLTAAHIDQLADSIASFHQQIEIASADTQFGMPETAWLPVEENFQQIRPRLRDATELARLDRLYQWCQEQFKQLSDTLKQRKKDGFIRNCHGDMHLANMTLIDDKVTIFDCIEFNDNFRWIDVISEIAFTTMDLIDRKQADFAARLLNRYLQHTGDYQGLALLQFYQVYRALVRAKVAIIRSKQPDISRQELNQSLQDYSDYSLLAESFIQSEKPMLFIAHGVSGSGKTSLTQPLLEWFGMIRLRSDIERKRLFGLTETMSSDSKTGAGIYSADAGKQTYAKLVSLAEDIIDAGYSTIVDATFLKREQRQLFHELAQRLQVPFVILHFHADESLLRQWINERLKSGKDASEATIEVLEHQLKTEQELTDDEADHIISIDSGQKNATDALISAIEKLYQN